MWIRMLFTPILLGCVLSVVVAYANKTTDQFRDVVQLPTEVIEESFRGFQLASDLYNYQNTTCFKEFNSKNTLLLTELKNETISCTETATQMKHLVRAYHIKSRSEFLDRLFETCDSAGHSEFENCLNNIHLNETHFVDFIERTTANVSQELENIDKVESDCLSKQIDESKVKSASIFCDLHQCLLGNSEPFLQEGNSTRKEDDCARQNISDCNLTSIPVPSNLEKCFRKLKEAYKNLETCVAAKQFQFNNCMERTEKLLKSLKTRLIEISSNNAKEINAYDRTENTCLRHFITGNIFPGFRLIFDLEKCLKNGFKGAVGTGNESENLIYGFWNLRIALWSCRVDSNKTSIEKCISETLGTSNEARAISRTIQSISEDELKNPNNKVYESFNNENDCIGYIFEKLKFRGLFMENLTKNEFKECINRRYVDSPDKVFLKDVINKYKSISNSLDKCTQYPVGSEFSICVSETIEASASSLNYILQNFNNFMTDTSSCNKCLEEILSRKDKLCSSNTTALCSYPDIERCLSNRKKISFGSLPSNSNQTFASLEAGNTITVTGYILPIFSNLTINFKIDLQNTALHVNPRGQSWIVVNNYENGGWSQKELAFPTLPTHNFHPGSKCVIRISISESFYTITINGVNLTNFTHRLPYKSVNFVEAYGDMDYISLERN